MRLWLDSRHGDVRAPLCAGDPTIVVTLFQNDPPCRIMDLP
jgi:hypothetical protein